MRRKIARPFGYSTSAMRLVSMLMALALLGAMFLRMKIPSTWQMFADDAKTPASSPDEPLVDGTEEEEIVPGPNDRDEAEVADIQTMFEMVADQKELKPWEMFAYWRLLQWSRTESFSDLQKRAQRDIPFTQFRDQPKKHRGQPIRLRLHVQRVFEWDATENKYGFEKAREVWGYTDESRPFWYCVVLAERPQGLPIGPDVRAEIEFVGYFLKTMAYTAADNQRGNQRWAPLLMGRAQVTAKPATVVVSSLDIWTVVLIGIGGVILVGFAVWMSKGFRPRPRPKLSMLPSELSGLNIAAEPELENPFEMTSEDSPK